MTSLNAVEINLTLCQSPQKPQNSQLLPSQRSSNVHGKSSISMHHRKVRMHLWNAWKDTENSRNRLLEIEVNKPCRCYTHRVSWFWFHRRAGSRRAIQWFLCFESWTLHNLQCRMCCSRRFCRHFYFHSFREKENKN